MGDAGPGAPIGGGDRSLTARQAQQWLLTLLPTFPVLLLVLRLWHLSRQDLSTMLLLVQYVSPLGLLTALLITLVWVLPLAVLLAGLLGRLLWSSAPDRFDPERSLLARTTVRTPGWVITSAVLLAALTWQLRFLPALLMMSLAVLGLHTRRRHPDDPARTRLACVALPLLAAWLAYAWLLPAIADAVRSGEAVTALLLAVPPGLAVFLTGPLPRRVAPPLTRWASLSVALTFPLLLGTIFLRAPILPKVAVEVDADPATPAAAGGPATGSVLLGRVITVNDRMTTLIDDRGMVQFVSNERVHSQTLCPETTQVPYSVVRVHGWPVEETALEWLIPRRPPSTLADPRCAGRLRDVGEWPADESAETPTPTRDSDMTPSKIPPTTVTPR
ncbi:hypothetical protein AB0J86_15810 [Micromonospora sp. NPDC049559]|uniref:hypothetical protein n=1 Tax=Micromonospora sp. NPDC049559 TaxID=3155923 RepID=UPI003427482C